MIRPQVIADELLSIDVIGNLTDVFQSIASIQIARIKRQVEASQKFFSELWPLYTSIRVGNPQRFDNSDLVTTNKQLFVVITAEGGFSGDIDQKLIRWMLGHYDPKTTDIVCIGHHGAIQLAQSGVNIVQYFKLPADELNINIAPIMDLITRYSETTAYYQTYVSLAVQDVKKISLQAVVNDLSVASKKEEVISARNYIFEPSEDEVVNYMETTMRGVALAQVILESKLAQYASRFRAMSESHEKANELFDELKVDLYRAKRAQGDERLKEVMAGLTKIRAGGRK